MTSQKKFSLAGIAGNLEGVTHLPDGEPCAIAIVAHPLSTMGGSMENKVVTTLAKTFVELGCVALRFNFRGAGGSEGEFDEGDGEVEDVLAVIEHARKGFGELPLILSGFSFGGYVQARAAQHVHPRPRLVLAAPAVGRFLMPQVPHGTLLVHGELDDIISLADLLQWARPQKLPIVVLPGAEHFFHGCLGQLREVVLHEFRGRPL